MVSWQLCQIKFIHSSNQSIKTNSLQSNRAMVWIFSQKAVIYFITLRAFCGQIGDAGGSTSYIIIFVLGGSTQKYKSCNDDNFLGPLGARGQDLN